ncbi:hypothetical protein [Nocardia sp. NPDC050175]|uniref:hypothetical protein n=1 Tax=Nocardia sp. NPDC050175 TaxID=3364317 RepID=UPI0037B62503
MVHTGTTPRNEANPVPYRPAHLTAAGITTVAALLTLAPTAQAETTSPTYHCETFAPGKPAPGKPAPGDKKPTPITGSKCTATNAPEKGPIKDFFFILDKAVFYVCGIAPNGTFASPDAISGTADLPTKLTATRCWAFKTDGKFSPEQFEQELAKQKEKKAPK